MSPSAECEEVLHVNHVIFQLNQFISQVVFDSLFTGFIIVNFVNA